MEKSLTIDDITVKSPTDSAGIEQLREWLENLSKSDAEAYGEALRTLADAARDSKWREVVKDGILKFVLERFDAESDSTLVSLQGLRLVGNCCIDHGMIGQTESVLRDLTYHR